MSRWALACTLPWIFVAGCDSGGVIVGDDDTAMADDDTSAGLVETIAGSPGGPGLADGHANDAHFFHPYGVTWHDQRVYIGDGWGQTIRVFDPATSEVTTLAGVPGEPGRTDSADGPARFNFPCGLEMGPDGLLYVADRDNGRIRTVDPTSGTVGTLADDNGVVLADEVFDVAFDADGHLYFTDVAGCSIRRVQLSGGVCETVAGVPGDCRIADGLPAFARVGQPRGLVHHPDGVLFYADRMGDNIRRFDLATGVLETVYGSSDGSEPGYVDAAGTDARFSEPSGLEVIGDMLYVTDSDNDGVRRIDLQSGTVTTLAGIGVNGNADGTVEESSFSWPIGLASDGGASLYVMDPGGHCLRHIDLDSMTVTTVAGTADNTGSVDGHGTTSRMTEPRALARGEEGTVWVMDSSNLEIRAFDIGTTEMVTVAGDPAQYEHLDGVGDEARFMTTTGGAWADGQLFVTEVPSATVRTVDAASRQVVTVAGTAMANGFADGTGAAARFANPRGIAAGGDGKLYVLDSGNRAIRRMDPITYEVETLLAPSDNPNPLANPEGMAADGDGTLYITDYASCTLVAVDQQTGEAQVVAGQAGACEERDGAGSAARFDRPRGLDVDVTTGLVYIASYGGHTIRVFDPATAEVSTVAGVPTVMDAVDGTLGTATFPTPVDVLVVDDVLLVLDLYAANIRSVDLD